MSRFWEIVRFELNFHSRRVATYLYFLILFGVSAAVLSTGVSVVGGSENVHGNAPLNIVALGTIILILFGFFLYPIAGTAIYRDFETNVHDLFFTSGITKRDYYMGRFAGVFLVSILVFAAIPLGLIFGTFVHIHSASKFGPFRAGSYISLFVEFIVPDVLLVSALSFVWGALTRTLTAIYSQGIVLAALWIFASYRAADRAHGSLLEPFGAASAAQAGRYWTLRELNGSLLPFSGDILYNRLIWLAVALATLVLGFTLFDLAHRPRSIFPERRKRSSRQSQEPVLLGRGARATPSAPIYAFASLARLTKLYFLRVTRSVPFALIVLTGVILLIATMSDSLKDNGIPILPVTRVVSEGIGSVAPVILYSIIAFYSGELVWSERLDRADQMTDVLPVPSYITLIARLAAMLLVCCVALSLFLISGMGIQVFYGYYHFELPIYLLRLFVLDLPLILSLTCLAFFLHTSINNRFAAIGGIVAVICVNSGLQYLGFERKIYLFGEVGELVYSDMNGFGPYLLSHQSWACYWLAFSFLLVVIASHLSLRGTENNFRARWRRARFTTTARLATALLLTTWLGIGVFSLYNTDALHKYRSSKDDNRLRADYERQYKAAWDRKPMPRIVSATLDITLYPERQQYAVRGTYRLRNKTQQPIRQVALDVNSDWTFHRLDFGGGAHLDHNDTEQGFRIYTLTHPLAPGSETTLDFDFAYLKHGFPNGNPETDIAENGTFLTNPAPHIGYQRDEELSDSKDRTDNKLPTRADMPPATDLQARNNTYIANDADWMSFDATVRTEPDQIAIAPGYLQREWMENGRRCFHYVMDAPIRNFYSIQSARYQVKRDTWTSPIGKKVALEIYYHPAHTYNLNPMMRGMKASLGYCSANFSPYQFHQLRIIESPIYRDYAQSFANTVPYSEGMGFIAHRYDTGKDIDYPFYVTAHETAHQWWGHQLQGADVAGSEVLAESLAEYSALMAMQHAYGRNFTIRYLNKDLDDYLRARTGDAGNENPLVSAQHQQYLHYNKGALVFYALADRIGEARLNGILSRFLRDKQYQEAPYATAPELLAYLKKDATPDERAYISDLFEHITLYSLRLEKATAAKLPNGKWHVSLAFSMKKFYEDSAGNPTAVPLHDKFTILVFAKPAHDDSDSEEFGKVLMRTSMQVNATRVDSVEKPFQIQSDLAEKPYRAGIDPYNFMIDRDSSAHTGYVQMR